MESGAGFPIPLAGRFATPASHQHWTAEEDSALESAVARVAIEDWAAVAKLVPGRTARQCRERFKFYLSPSPPSEWTREEDHLLVNLNQQFGPAWNKIAPHLPQHTETTIKNRSSILLGKTPYEPKQWELTENEIRMACRAPKRTTRWLVPREPQKLDTVLQ